MPNDAPSWLGPAGIAHLPAWATDELSQLRVIRAPRGTVAFRPGEEAKGCALVLSGRLDVFLAGPAGREILLYTVGPGQSCIETTLALMGRGTYSGEGVAGEDSEVVVIPPPLFARLMDEAPAFRALVFDRFAARMQEVMGLLERVAFQRVESRLAAALLALGRDGVARATQAELAARVGTAREVVSRRLDGFARRGWVETDRGAVRLIDPGALRRLAALDDQA